MIDEMTTVLEPSPMPDFVETKFTKSITQRALSYIKAGFPVHFRGISGSGKTTLAMHIASKIKRPVVMIHETKSLLPRIWWVVNTVIALEKSWIVLSPGL